MESPASASVPRIYVPVSRPDSTAPTYAVLQLLGFSPPADPTKHTSSPRLLHHCFAAPPSPSSAPLELLSCSPSPLSDPLSPAPKNCSSPFNNSSKCSREEKLEKKFTSIKHSPMKKSASNSGQHISPLSPGARRINGKSLPLGGPTISITHTQKDAIIHTNSSDFRELVHKLTGATSGNKKELLPVTHPTRASVRSSSASVGDEALPARALTQKAGGCHDRGSMLQPMAGSSTTTLLERRKSNKVLERLTTSCRNLPPVVPSPGGTLLASADFEKTSSPSNPMTSEGSSTVVTPVPRTPAAGASPLSRVMESFPGTKKSASLEISVMHNPNECQAGSLESMDADQGLAMARGSRHDAGKQSALNARNMCAFHAKDMQGPSLGLSTPVPDAMDVQDGVTSQEMSLHHATDTEGENLCNGEGVQSLTEMDDKAHDEESAIAKKSFFVHSQRPRCGDPTLLCLFPESSR